MELSDEFFHKHNIKLSYDIKYKYKQYHSNM